MLVYQWAYVASTGSLALSADHGFGDRVDVRPLRCAVGWRQDFHRCVLKSSGQSVGAARGLAPTGQVGLSSTGWWLVGNRDYLDIASLLDGIAQSQNAVVGVDGVSVPLGTHKHFGNCVGRSQLGPVQSAVLNLQRRGWRSEMIYQINKISKLRFYIRA